MDAKTLQTAFDIAKEVLPEVVGWVLDLIRAGKSPAEAGAIVKRNIQSRRAEYEAQKAADERALAKKHGLPVDGNPYEEDET